jgi:hypothetical protein
MDFHIMRCWQTAKLATNSSFHLVLKGIPDATMKRPCSGYRGSRHTDDSMVGSVTWRGDNNRQHQENSVRLDPSWSS